MVKGKLIYYGSVKDGIINLPKRISREIKKRFDDHIIMVTIERKRKTRSNKQNAYYWGVIIPEVVAGMIDLGNELQIDNKIDHEVVHKFLVEKFLIGKDIVLDGGEIDRLPPSSKNLTTIEMEEYLEEIRRWAAIHLSISIPEPNEQTQLNF